jgi:GT2 family glycosyltransferase
VKLGYTCTNFSNRHFTVDAARSLVASAGGGHKLHIVVVDNQSAPQRIETLHQLASEYAAVDLLLNDQNVGHFLGLNCGIRRMRVCYHDVKHLVIGNNDLLFMVDFCAAVERKLTVLHQHAVLSLDIVTLDGEHQNPHVISSISKTR